MKNQRVLVIGGVGFICLNPAKGLAEQNEVVILDALFTDSMKTIKQLLKKANVRFIRGREMMGCFDVVYEKFAVI